MAFTARQRLWSLGTLLSLFGGAACSSGGGGAAPATVDVTGYWQLYLTPMGGTESGPSCVYLSQTGNAIDGAAMSGTVSGNSVNVTATAAAFTITIAGTATATTVSGTLTISGMINGTGTFRMDRFTPTGTMTVNGTVGSTPVSLDIATAAGSRSYSDVAKTVLTQVSITAAIGSEHCDIDFTPTGLGVGTLGVPATVDVTVTYRNDTTELELAATAGTLTVTRYDGSGFAGSYSLTLTGGGTVTGSFDVAWDIAAYDP